MKNFGIAAGLALAVGMTTAGSLAAAQGNVDGKKYDKGAPITLQGCVVTGEVKDTWLVVKLNEWPKPASNVGKYGKRYFWLDKVGKDVKDYVGQTIQITGEITEVRKAEMEIERREDGQGMMVEIETMDAKITTSLERAEVVGAVLGQDIPITVVRVKVGGMKSVSPTCQ